jgi:hypothetical protein
VLSCHLLARNLALPYKTAVTSEVILPTLPSKGNAFVDEKVNRRPLAYVRSDMDLEVLEC